MDQPQLIQGTFFDIQGFSVHDGPGCRTLIFFKGCSLSCAWCCNPEGLSTFPEPLYNASKCIFDDLCIIACPHHAIKKNGNSLNFTRTICEDCTTHDCVKACCTGALRLGGFTMGIEKLLDVIQRDRQYWGSDGGITLTGGEPFLQPDFARQILKRCFESYIHTAVETCCNVPWESIEPSLPFIDWILFDLKQTDNQKHLRWTSRGSSLILDNARRLAESFKGRLMFRMPVIPGFNDDDLSVHKISDFIKSIGKDEINILPAHHLGKEKYKLVGKGYYTEDLKTPSNADLLRIQSIFEWHKIRCYIGSETPF
jgi:pyruvate formate lyase activating enzyme